MAFDGREGTAVLLAWGLLAAALRGEIPRDFSPAAARRWLESGSPLAAEKLRKLKPEQRGAWLGEAARDVSGLLQRLCPGLQEKRNAAPAPPEEQPQEKRPAPRTAAPERPCFFAFSVGPDPYVPECARCLWPRIGRCGGRAA